MSFYYKVYGFAIKSEFEIPELIAINKIENPDVYIKYDKVPETIENPVKTSFAFQANKKEFLLKVSDIAKYYITNGNKITIEKSDNITHSEMNLFLLGSAFGALIFQKNKIPFHGSTVNINDKLVIISGISGAGKSTIVAKFVKENYKLFSDDVTALYEQNGEIYAEPGFPQIKLWQDTLEMLSLNYTNLKKIRPSLQKFKYPVQNFINEPQKVDAVIVIKTKNSYGIEFEEIKGVEKFKILTNNTYRKQFIEGLQAQATQFKIIAGLASKTKLYILQRPNSGDTINEVYEKIKEII